MFKNIFRDTTYLPNIFLFFCEPELSKLPILDFLFLIKKNGDKLKMAEFLKILKNETQDFRRPTQ